MGEITDSLWYETPPDQVIKVLGNDTITHMERALSIVQKDVYATYRRLGKIRLQWVSPDGEYPATEEDDLFVMAYVALQDGSYYSGGSDVYAGGSDTTGEVLEGIEDAIYSVAQCTQDYVISVELREWPICPQHNRILHLGASPTWHCEANGGHDVAKIGSLAKIDQTP